MERFGERLKELRKAAGLTQTGLADALLLHPQTVSKWERGFSEPDISQLGDLADALGVSLEKLCGQEDAAETFRGPFNAERFGKMLSELRIACKESQDHLAELLGTSSDAVSRWERGVTCPDIEKLSALASHFEIPVSRLYCSIEETQKTESVTVLQKRRRVSVLLFAAIALVCVTGILLAVLFAPSPAYYTVTVNGQTVSVEASDWFIPEEPSRTGYDLAGWKDENGREVTFPCKIVADTSFEPVFVLHTYSVDYWLNGGYFDGAVQTGFTVESGTLELPVPEKAGQIFEGWYLSADYSGEPVERIVCEAADVVLYAKWSTPSFTIRYELGGGILYEENPTIVTAAEAFVLFAPIREGYLFLGWFDRPENGTRYESVGGETAANLTLYALWQQTDAQFTIYYECDGTLMGENPASVGAGEVHKLNGAFKAGYTFLGWNTQADGGGEYVEYLYGVDDTLHLYAIFEPKEYVVRYIFEGTYAGEETNPNTVVFGESVTLLPVELYGHAFIGWYDAEEGGNKVEVIDASNIQTITALYARFEPLRFTLVLQAGGGTVEGGVAAYTVAFGESLRLPSCKRVGYDFLGWNERADGSGAFYTVFTGSDSNRELYAVYAPKEFLVRYDYEGVHESGKVNPNYITYGETVNLYPVYLPGYTFVGWYDAKAGGTRVEVIDENNLLDITWLYARFKPLRYAITLDADGGFFETPEGKRSEYTFTLAYGETFELPLCTRDGYAFLSWVDADGNEIAKITSVNVKDMMLTASWMQTGAEYHIEYVLGGGAMEEANPDTALSDVIASLHDPVRKGYLFLGWYDNPDGIGEPYLGTPLGRTEDLMLYALWQEIKVSGSAEYFDYEKTSTEVTITDYRGPTGANVDVVIPSVIDGLPVTQIGSNTVGQSGANMVLYGIFGAPYSAEIRSLTIPEGVLVLKENAFDTLKVAEPLHLPSTVERIEDGCFSSFDGEIIFSESGNLTYIGENAFHGVRFVGTLVIPYGVKTIAGSAFYNVKTTGVILPDTVEMISNSAFYQPNGYIERMYIPASVVYVGFRALSGGIYTSLSAEQATMFDPSWGGAAVYNVQKSTVTLIDGETRRALTGEAFALPSPQREGYTFLGWQDESGKFVGDCYIPNRNATLTAVYEKRSETDGRTLGTAAVLEVDKTYEFTLLDGQVFYFRPNILQTCRILITVTGDFRRSICRVRDNMTEVVIADFVKLVDFRAGDVFYVETDPIPSGTVMTIQLMVLPNE